LHPLLSYFAPRYGVARLAEITWVHAVNTQARLRSACASAAMMLECDVRASPTGAIILAHPPETESGLTFAALLDAARPLDKGLKLDFKDPDVVPACLEALRDAPLAQPVLLNADIIQGQGAGPPAVDGAAFIAACTRLYPRGILSLGWTTTAPPAGGYTGENVAAMLEQCAGRTGIVFPVRASLLPGSWAALQPLTRQPGAVLSLWDSDPVDPPLYAWITTRLPRGDYLYDCVTRP
jgi:menorin-like protein